MKKRTKSKLQPLDFAFGALCLLAAGFFSWLFWYDLNSYTTRSDKQKIATISFKQKVAQRKFDDRAVWERISQDAVLYDGDTISTSDFAQATITFNDGTKMDVYENTMLQLYYDAESGLRIALDGGDIQVDSSEGTSQVSLSLDGGSVVSMEKGASVSVNAGGGGQSSSIMVTGGGVSLSTETGEALSLSFGEAASISAEGSIAQNPLSVVFPPKELNLLSTDGNARTVTIEWRLSGGQEPVTVQTSQTKDFARIQSETTVTGSLFHEIRVPPGSLYWRVFAERAPEASVMGKVLVEKISPVRLVSPSLGAELSYRREAVPVLFRWEGSELSSKFRFVLSQSADLSNPLMDFELSDSFVSLDSVPDGTWYWQVFPWYQAENTGYAQGSAIGSFSILHDGALSAPELLVPVEDAELSYGDESAVNFIWKGDDPEGYEILVSPDSAFLNTVLSERTSQSRISHTFAQNELRDGTYYWKVRALSGGESVVREVSFSRRVPGQNKLLYPPDGFEVLDASSVQFMWRLSDEAQGADSVLQLSPLADFSRSVVERTTSASFLDGLSLSDGVWWWRVLSRAETGESASEPRKLTVLVPLEAPVVQSPRMGETLVSYGTVSVPISWRAVHGASYYDVTVSDSSGNVAARTRVSGTDTQVRLSEGSYTVGVSAALLDGSEPRQGDSLPVSFSVRTPQVVQLSSPAQGARIAGLSALRSPVTFRWVPGADASQGIRFVLSRMGSDGSFRVVEERALPSGQNSVSLSRLPSGTYSWRVQAVSRDGLRVDSAERQFVILSVAELPSPRLALPSDGQVLDGAFFRENRSIEFRWSAVEGANAYTFTLFRRTAGGTYSVLLTERNIARTAVTISDLSLLDVGEYAWTVTAAGIASDGYEERRSNAARSTFSINFESPTKVQGNRPEDSYGS